MRRLLILAACAACAAALELPPITGDAVAGLESYDRVITGLLLAYDVPGAAVAVGRGGRVIYARGFGHADPARTRPVRPESLFRIASVSKPITAVAVLRLVEQGRLELDRPVLEYLGGFEPPVGAQVDERWRSITVRHLLHHAGGFDRGASGDPMFRPATTAQALGEPAPATARTIVRYMLGQPLDFDPGTREAYSNFGYCVLGRVIEQVTGQSYEEFVRAAVLAPLGITTMRIGSTRVAERDPLEVGYSAGRHPRLGQSVFGAEAEQVAPPDGSFYLEAMDSHGGWIASAPDLVRFMLGCDGRDDAPDLLRPATVTQMYAKPDLPFIAADAEAWYAMGWSVRNAGDGFNAWHTGLLTGTRSLIVRAGNGLCWAVLYNASPAGLDGATDSLMWAAAQAVDDWPD